MICKWPRVTALLLALLLLAGCAAPEPGPASEPVPAPVTEPETAPEPAPPAEPTLEERQVEFLAFLEEVNASRRAIYENTEPIAYDEAWMPDLTDLEGVFTQEEMEAFFTPPENGPRTVTAQEAAEDVETAFLLLKHAYGAYDYFGGDEVFLPLRDEVLEKLPGEGRVESKQLEQMLADALAPVLVDGHFTIGDTPMRTMHSKYMYHVPYVFFDDPTGLDPDLVKPTLDNKGRLCWCFATLVSHEEQVNLPSSAQVDGETVELNWTWAEPAQDSREVFSRTTLADGTPLLISTTMRGETEEAKAQLAELADCGEEYADAPVLVLDVRCNGGGSNKYISNWFAGYTGQQVNIRFVQTLKFTPINMSYYTNADWWDMDFSGKAPYWSFNSGLGAWVGREGLTLVLQDKGIASAGESAVENLRAVENCLFLGSNTGGCALTPNNFHHYLPHSGLDLYFGTGWHLTDDGQNRDGVGYLPDLWVPPSRVLERTEKMIVYYDLTNLMG